MSICLSFCVLLKWLPVCLCGSLSVSVCSPPFPVVSITTSIPLSACVFYYLYVCLSVCLLNYPFVRIYLSCPFYPFDKICLTIPLSVCLPVFFSIINLKFIRLFLQLFPFAGLFNLLTFVQYVSLFLGCLQITLSVRLQYSSLMLSHCPPFYSAVYFYKHSLSLPICR